MEIKPKSPTTYFVIAGITVTSIAFIQLLDYLECKYHLKQKLFNSIWNKIGPQSDRKLGRYKRELFSEATGVCLEIGSGTGPTFKYLSKEAEHTTTNNTSGSKHLHSKITKLIALEPNPFMQDKLLKSVQDSSSPFEIQIVAKKFQQAINDGDIKYGTFDTVICNLVICSIPNKSETLIEIQKLLKPNGKLLFIEHVISESFIGSTFQRLINPLWKQIGDGCCLTSETDQIIKNMDWARVTINQINLPQLPFKHIYGIAQNNK